MVDKANRWFTDYLPTITVHPLFQGVKYNWNQARTFEFKNGYEIVAVPLIEREKPIGYWGKRELILYPRKDGKGFFTKVLEVYGNEKYIEKYGRRYTTRDFSGLLIYWNLTSGFNRGMYFENSKYISEVKVEPIDRNANTGATNRSMVQFVQMGPADNWWYSWWTYYQQSVINDIMYGGGGSGNNPCEYSPCTGTTDDPLLQSYGYDFYTMMNDLNSWDDLDNLNNSLGYSDFSTQNLRNLGYCNGPHI